MISTLPKLLTEIGLSPREATVLNLLLQSEKLKAIQVAQQTKINRTTTYGILQSLIKKGLVSSLTEYSVTFYQSIDPGLLPSYIKRRQEFLAEKKEEIEALVPEIEKMKIHADALPRVSFFEGVEGVKQAYEDTLENNKGKEIFVFSGPDAVFQEMSKEYVEYYVKKRTKLNIHSYQIAPKTEWGKYIQSNDSKVLRITKLIPKEFAFDTEMVIYDNKLGIFSFKSGRLIAIIIEDETISKTLKTLFRYLNTTLK